MEEEFDLLLLQATAYDWKENERYFIGGNFDVTKRIKRAKKNLINYINVNFKERE